MNNFAENECEVVGIEIGGDVDKSIDKRWKKYFGLKKEHLDALTNFTYSNEFCETMDFTTLESLEAFKKANNTSYHLGFFHQYWLIHFHFKRLYDENKKLSYKLNEKSELNKNLQTQISELSDKVNELTSQKPSTDNSENYKDDLIELRSKYQKLSERMAKILDENTTLAQENWLLKRNYTYAKSA